MSEQQNIETVQQAYATFSRGDIQSLLGIMADDVRWTTPEVPGAPHSGTRTGRDQVAEFFRLVAELWEFSSFEPKQYIASGDDVAVRGSYSGRARTTGRSFSCDWVMAWTFRNGKVAAFQEYTDTAALMAALASEAVAARR